ncbi:MAG: c-type cytochrome [Zoogloea sp.]|nr:c-type cytochrome [Zoogloea sp.]
MNPIIRVVLAGLLALTAQAAFAHGTAEPAVASFEADVTSLPPLPPGEGNTYRGNAQVAAFGRALFNQTCARCHGVDAVSKNLPGPDLTRLDRACRPIADAEVRARCMADNDAFFLDSVQNGKVRVGVSHMPAWKGVLSPQLIWTLRTFLESKAPARRPD